MVQQMVSVVIYATSHMLNAVGEHEVLHLEPVVIDSHLVKHCLSEWYRRCLELDDTNRLEGLIIDHSVASFGGACHRDGGLDGYE